MSGGDAFACGGLLMGTAGLLFAAPAIAIDALAGAGLITVAEGITQALTVQGAMLGGAGTLIDTTGLLQSYGSNC